MAPEEKDEEKKLQEKKEKLRNYVSKITKNPYNLGLTGVIILAAVLRLYFFFIAKNQAHWWDTLAFGSIARNIILHLWDTNSFLIHENIIRPPLLSLVWSLLLRINLSESAILFVLEIIPSIFSVLLIYLIAKELYNQRIALISSFILSVLWIHLFYSVRIMSDIPALFFALVSLYFFIKSYDNFDIKLFSLSIFFIVLAILTRYFYGLIGAVYIFMIIIKHKHKFIYNKNFWKGGIIGAVPLFIFFIYNLIVYKGLMPAASVYASSASEKPAFAYYVLNFIGYDLNLMFAIFFVLGLIVILAEIGLRYDSINKSKKLLGHLMLLLIALFSFIFFIFILRAAEDRYLFLLLPSLVIFSATGIDFLYISMRKYNKTVAIILMGIILLVGAYSNISYGNVIIENKKVSYAQMKEAFLWINENTERSSVVAGDGIDPYLIYYSARVISYFNITSNSFDKNPDYIVLHGFEHQTPELINYVNNHQSSFASVYANYFDQARQNPAVVIYRVVK